MSSLLSVDVGTTSVKAGLFYANGACICSSTQGYSLLTPSVDWVELDAETYWEAVCAVVRKTLSKSDLAGRDVKAVAVSSQGETTIAVDAVGHPLQSALVWLDSRARQEAVWLKEQLGDEVYAHTGIPEVNPTWTACKIAWLRNNRPQVFKATHKFLLAQDFVIHRLTNQFVTDGAVACTTLLYDIVEHVWWPKALQAVGLEPERMPQISSPGAVAGGLTSEAAEILGLRPDIPVILAGMDQAAGAVGAGIITPEVIAESTGGALAIQVTVSRPDMDPSGRIPVYVHSAPGCYLFVPVCDTGGMALKWFRDTFGENEIEQAAREGRDVYDQLTQLASEVVPGSDGLLMLPHLAGAFSPEYNPHARGVFHGFTLFHRKPHFVRAVLESVAYMLRRNLELIGETGIRVRELRATGGGARSRLWRQIKADVCRVPVVTLRFGDTALLGGAMLAAVAIGLFPSLEEANRSMVCPAERLEPIPENVEFYEKGYQSYCRLYDALTPMFQGQFSRG